ncbi:MAG: hypothetical protein HFJ33_08165, partial [Clostridia bacterium]|nr:hypothetical protein [Clostridia bacterium]
VKEQASDLEKTDYSEASWAKLEEALALPEEKQSEVNAKVEAIEKAMAELTVDRTALQAILEKVSDLEESEYTVESWNALKDSLVGIDDLSKQSEIDKKVEEIQTALNGLTIRELVASDFVTEDPRPIYDGKEKSVEVTTKLDGVGKITVVYKQEGKVVTPINAGQYDVYVNVEAGTKYGEVSDLKVGTLTILKATYYLNEQEVIFRSATEEYDGRTWYSVIVQGKPNGIKVEYTDNEAINAGTYNAVATFTIDENSELFMNYDVVSPATMEATLTINKKQPSKSELDVVPTKVEYDGKVKEIKVVPAKDIVGMGEIVSLTYISRETKEVVENPTEVGTYDVRATIAEGQNYKGRTNFLVGAFTITPKTLTEADIIVTEPVNAVYNTTPQGVNISIEANKADITITYFVKGEDGAFTELGENQVPVDVGTYKATVVATGKGNYEGTVTIDSNEYTIEKANQEKPVISLSANSVMMTDEAPTLKVENLEEAKVAVSYQSSNEEVATIDNTGKITLMGAGTTTITVIYEGNKNYIENSSSVELAVALDKSELIAIVAQANDLEETDYSEASWAELEKALALPEDVQSQIDAKVEAIKEAIAGLTVDKTALEAIKAQANDLEETD